MAAETDFRQIVRWSAQQFGKRQARLYANTLSLAVQALAAGSAVLGARRRPDIGKGLMTLHVARAGRKGRHFVLFRARQDADHRFIEILRIVHDAMDPPRQGSPEDAKN